METNKNTYEDLEIKIWELEKKAGFFQLISDNSYGWELYRDVSGKILYTNNSFERITGYKKEDLLNGNISEKNFVHPSDYERVKFEIEQIKNQITVIDFEFRIITKEGSIKHVSLCSQPVYKGIEFIGVRTTILDVTDNKRYEDLKSARDKESITANLLQIISENIPAFIAVVDISTLRYKFANKSYTKNFNKKIDEVIGSHISEVIGESNAEFAMKHIEEVRLGKPSSYINTFKLVEGTKTFHVNFVPAFNEIGQVTDIIVLSYDITALKKVEGELQESKEKYAKIFDRAPVLISITDIETGIYIDVNSFALGFSGFTRDEVIGHRSVDIGWISAENRKLLADTLRTKGRIDGLELDFKTKSNETVYGIVNGEKMLIDNKECILTITTDITERKKMELLLKEKNEEIESQNEEYKQINEELQLAKEKAEESDKLKSAFLQNISHEIRTPMNAITGFSKMLNYTDLSDEKRKSFVSIIQSSSNQLLTIVSDILTISSIDAKQEKVHITSVCINCIIVDLLAIFKTQASSRNISIFARQQLTDKQSEIYTDKTKITQILSNLIANSLKFTHEGTIEFGYNLENSEMHSRASQQDKSLTYLQFYVKDTGIGIKTEMHEIIFERFRQENNELSKRYSGTGLGLAISKAFIELLGGKIWVQSDLGKGSTFYFTIPYNPVNVIDKQDTTLENQAEITTIIVAEDEEYNFLFIEEILFDMDLKLIHTKNGKETVEVCRENLKINLVLMDIKMPILDGHSAATQIKEFRPGLPIIAQSAYALEHEIAKYRGIFDDYITKPINAEELISKILKYLQNK